MASRQQARKQQATKGHEEEAGQGQGQAMNLEEIGKYRAEAQQRSADAIRAAEDRFNKANTQQQQAQAHEHGGSETPQQWLADAAADARARCNKALGTTTSPPAAAHQGKQEGGGQGQQVHGHLTRQDEMGKHGSEAQKSSTAEAARAAVEKHHADDKDTAEKKTQEATGTAAAKAKDVTAGAAGTAAEYARQAAVKAKDVTLGTGETAAEYAKQAAEKAKEAAVAAAKTTAGYTQQAAVKAKDVTVSTGAQVAHRATEVTADAARSVAEYAREKAEQSKERAARAADQAEEPAAAGCGAGATTAQAKDSAASQTADMTGQHKDTTAGGMARNKAADTAVQAKDTGASMFRKAGDTAVHAKDMAKDATGGGRAQRSRDTAPEAGDDKAKDDATGRAGHKAGEVKEKASGATKAKGGGGDDEGTTTVVGDVLEAVGATVVGLAQHAKGIVAGEEELVPVQGEKGELTGGGEEEKRKLA